MTSPTFLRLLPLLGAAAIASAPLTAHAQDDAPAARPAPPSAVAANGEYVAPLSQTTQPTYVPQSVALSGPSVLSSYTEGAPVPDGYHPETRARRGMIIGGAVTFGSTYLLSLMVATAGSDATRNRDETNPVAALYVPVLGPFMQMTSTSSSTANLFLAIDGAAQAAGAAMLVYGLISPKTVLVRNDLGSASVTPMHMGKDGMGVGLTGTF